MSTVNCRCNAYEPMVNSPLVPASGPRRWHRLEEVQREQGVSDRTMAARLGISADEFRRQKSPTADLPLSELYRWQSALDVPIADLLVEPGPTLAPPVERRARLVKVMKTVRSLQLASDSPEIHALVEQLAGQVVELMPELIHVDSWPIVGKRRSSNDIAPIEERAMPESLIEGTWRPHSERE